MLNNLDAGPHLDGENHLLINQDFNSTQAGRAVKMVIATSPQGKVELGSLYRSNRDSISSMEELAKCLAELSTEEFERLEAVGATFQNILTREGARRFANLDADTEVSYGDLSDEQVLSYKRQCVAEEITPIIQLHIEGKWNLQAIVKINKAYKSRVNTVGGVKMLFPYLCDDVFFRFKVEGSRACNPWKIEAVKRMYPGLDLSDEDAIEKYEEAIVIPSLLDKVREKIAAEELTWETEAILSSSLGVRIMHRGGASVLLKHLSEEELYELTTNDGDLQAKIDAEKLKRELLKTEDRIGIDDLPIPLAEVLDRRANAEKNTVAIVTSHLSEELRQQFIHPDEEEKWYLLMDNGIDPHDLKEDELDAEFERLKTEEYKRETAEILVGEVFDRNLSTYVLMDVNGGVKDRLQNLCGSESIIPILPYLPDHIMRAYRATRIVDVRAIQFEEIYRDMRSAGVEDPRSALTSEQLDLIVDCEEKENIALEIRALLDLHELEEWNSDRVYGLDSGIRSRIVNAGYIEAVIPFLDPQTLDSLETPRLEIMRAKYQEQIRRENPKRKSVPAEEIEARIKEVQYRKTAKRLNLVAEQFEGKFKLKDLKGDHEPLYSYINEYVGSLVYLIPWLTTKVLKKVDLKNNKNGNHFIVERIRRSIPNKPVCSVDDIRDTEIRDMLKVMRKDRIDRVLSLMPNSLRSKLQSSLEGSLTYESLMVLLKEAQKGNPNARKDLNNHLQTFVDDRTTGNVLPMHSPDSDLVDMLPPAKDFYSNLWIQQLVVFLRV